MPHVMTTTGPVPSAELGRTLPHEHFFVNIMAERRGDGLLADEALVTRELGAFTAQSGATIFELSNSRISEGALSTHRGHSEAIETRPAENVAACLRVAENAGVRLVLSTGYYRDPYLPETHIDEHSTSEIAEYIVRDLEEGFPGTDVKAGVIGEVGANKWFVTAREERSFRAAARAHRKTGRAIYTHAVFWPVAEQQIEILKEEGVDLSKVAIGHTDTVPTAGYAVELARHGVYIGVDSIQSANPHAVEHRVRMVTDLIRAGYLERILVSHDLCMPSHLTVNGGNGFGFVFGGFREKLLAAGVTEEEFDVITTRNPARLVEF